MLSIIHHVKSFGCSLEFQGQNPYLDNEASQIDTGTHRPTFTLKWFIIKMNLWEMCLANLLVKFKK